MPNAQLPSDQQSSPTPEFKSRDQAAANDQASTQHQVFEQPAQQDQDQSSNLYQQEFQAQQPENSQPTTESAQTNASQYPHSKIEESRIAPGMYRPLPEETVIEWMAPSRPFRKHNKKYFSTVTIIALLISLILGFAGQLTAVTVVISIVFLVYVLSVIPPIDVEYKITTYGIHIEKNLYYWEELGNFWFDKKYNQTLLNIASFRFPGRITLLLGKQNKALLTEILSEVLLHKKPELTLYEKASAWLQKIISLDTDD